MSSSEFCSCAVPKAVYREEGRPVCGMCGGCADEKERLRAKVAWLEAWKEGAEIVIRDLDATYICPETTGESDG